MSDRVEELVFSFWDELEDREIDGSERLREIRATVTNALERVLRAAVDGDDVG